MRQDDLKEANDRARENIDEKAEGSILVWVFWAFVAYGIYEYFIK